MKKNSVSNTARATLATLLVLAGIFLVALAFSNIRAATGPTPFSGTYDPNAFPCATTRHHFMVPAGEVRIIVQVSAWFPNNDLSVSLLFGAGANPVFIDTEDTGTSSEALIWEPNGGVPTGEYQVQVCQTPNTQGVPQNANTAYNGTFTTDNTPTPGGVGPTQFGPIAPAPQDNGPKIGYETFHPPGDLVTMTTSSQGPIAATVEYLGHDAGEPSIGVNFNSAQDPVNGLTAFQADLQTLFVKFNESCPSNGATASWYRSQAPTSQVANQDPIGFVDRATGRVFAGQLTLLTPTCKISFTDTDGKDPIGNPNPDGWVPSTGPLGSGVDHQTIGGGPYHPPMLPTWPAGYPHAVYYMSQQLGPGFSFRSDNGGLTFPIGPVDMWVSQCGGLHGHVKVTPNTAATRGNGKVGTVFLPNNSCGNDGAVVVSEDNGLTWNIRPVGQTTSNPNFQDPAVAIDDNGRVYFAMSSTVAAGPASPGGGSQIVVATSDNNGQTWQQVYDVSGGYGLKNIMYPAAVAGDAGRAAVAFYGTTTGGDPTIPSFKGIWHLYVAHTFDGGAHWTTSAATPNDPVQRGPIWAKGAADIARNMLDFFDITMDKQGRVQVGYADGCVDGHCVQANTANGNAYTALSSITRQSSGRRLLAAVSTPATEPPGIPALTAKRVGSIVTLSWSEADTGNSAITGYQVLRGIAPGTELPLGGVLPANQLTFTDNTATDPTKTYYYKVLAMNSVGTSCGNNEVAATYNGDTCTGLIVQRTPPGHPEQPAGANTAAPSLAIDSVAVGEPPNTDLVMFKMKVTNMGATPPANSRWRIVWNSYAAVPYDADPTDATVPQQFYVGMTTDGSSNVKFEWGVLSTAVVGLVVGVPTEFEQGLLPGSSFSPDGTITLFIPKSKIGNPQPGDLLGAVNGRTFTGDTTETQDLQRSTLLIDHTFVKAQRDNGHPAATYTIVGNQSANCPTIPNVVSRKVHTGVGPFEIGLPLTGPAGVEMRNDGTNTHQVVFRFARPVTFTSASVTPEAGKSATIASTSPPNVASTQVIVNLSNVTNAQTITINLLGVANLNPTPTPISVRMGVLQGDANQTRLVDGNDVSFVQSRTRQRASAANFKADINASGLIDGNDVSATQSKTRTALR